MGDHKHPLHDWLCPRIGMMESSVRIRRLIDRDGKSMARRPHRADPRRDRSINSEAGAGGMTRSGEGRKWGEHYETRGGDERRAAHRAIPAALAFQNGFEIVAARAAWEKEPAYVPEAVRIAPAVKRRCVSISQASWDEGPRARWPPPSR